MHLTGRIHDVASDAGFTLIEIIVSLLLMVIVSAMIGGFVIGAFSNTNRAVSQERALALADKAQEHLAGDLRSARAKDRTSARLRTRDEVRRAIRDFDSPEWDVQDVRTAKQNRLVFQSDVYGETLRPECVVYSSSVSDGKQPTYSLTRTVYDYSAGCRPLGKKLDTDPIIANVPVPANAAENSYDNVFTYWLTRPNNNQCQTVRRSTNLTGKQARFITGVHVNLADVMAMSGGSAASQDLKFNVSIRTRQNYDYQYALRCIR